MSPARGVGKDSPEHAEGSFKGPGINKRTNIGGLLVFLVES